MEIFEIKFCSMVETMTRHGGIKVIEAVLVAEGKISFSQFQIIFQGRRRLISTELAVWFDAPPPPAGAARHDPSESHVFSRLQNFFILDNITFVFHIRSHLRT